MEEMKWSSSGFLAVLVAINLGFGMALLAEICRWHDMSNISHTEPS
jgi:hypothetical protein